MNKVTGMSLLPVRCPRCGWHTLGLTDSDAVLLCPNCHDLWEEAHGTFVQREYFFAKTDIVNPHYLPFWTYQLIVHTQAGDIKDFHAYTHLIAFTQTIERIENRSLILFVAAFRFRAEAQRLNISKRYTYKQPVFEPGDPRKGLAWGPVLPDKTARNYGRTIFISTLSENRKNSKEFVSGVSITLQIPILMFIPFHLEGQYMRDPVSAYTVQHRLLTDKPACIGPI